MKRILPLGLFSLFLVFAATTLNAQNITTAKTYCFTDGFGYQWVFDRITNNHDGTYSATGKLYNAYPSGSATLWIDLSNGHKNSPIEIHGINDNADGCASGYTDSFVYVGTSTCTATSFTASGTWQSYCSGTVVGTGTWSASGPCTGAKVQMNTKTIITPARSVRSGDITTAKQYHRVCFDDIFAYHWYEIRLQDQGNNIWYGEGELDNAYPEAMSRVWVDISNGLQNASVEIHGVNLNPDGCTFYTDSFIYYGNADITLGSQVSYTGSGTFDSYCFGGVLFSGTWSGSGPTCDESRPKITPKPGPALAKHDMNFSISVAPNPVKNYVQLQYKVSSASKVNITIYDYMHRPVKILVNESKTSGNYSVSWNVTNSNGTRVQSGLYRVVSIVNGKVYSTTIQVL